MLPDYAFLDEIYITDEDVREAIIRLNSNKAPGPDLISPRLFKEGMQQLVPQLRRLFNLSLRLKKHSRTMEKVKFDCYSQKR